MYVCVGVPITNTASAPGKHTTAFYSPRARRLPGHMKYENSWALVPLPDFLPGRAESPPSDSVY